MSKVKERGHTGLSSILNEPMQWQKGKKTKREKDQILKAGKAKDGAIIRAMVEKQKRSQDLRWLHREARLQ